MKSLFKNTESEKSMLLLRCLVMYASAAPQTVALQAPLSLTFPRQEYWSELTFPSPGEFSQPKDQTHVSRIGRRIF